VGLVWLAACTGNDTKAPPTSSLPTITALPVFLSETPRVTATLTPSNTPTPSDTPTPTQTATPVTPTATYTLTPTPPIIGRVVSNQENVNVRREASFGSPVLTSVEAGAEIEIHGLSEDRQWYKVRLIDEEGALVDGWINAPLISLGSGIAVPTIGPTLTPSRTPQASPTGEAGSPIAFVTVTPNGSPGTPVPTVASTPGEFLSEKNVLAYCRTLDEDPPRITAEDTVSIWWSWFVRTPELMDEHLAHAEYEVLLDGRLLTNYKNYQQPIQREGGDWYVYWYVPVGTLAPGRHEVTYRLTWYEPVNDGYEDFGPGTPNEVEQGNCVFTVEE
jgi:hypothetical protein